MLDTSDAGSLDCACCAGHPGLAADDDQDQIDGHQSATRQLHDGLMSLADIHFLLLSNYSFVAGVSSTAAFYIVAL